MLAAITEQKFQKDSIKNEKYNGCIAKIDKKSIISAGYRDFTTGADKKFRNPLHIFWKK
ncbi:hypothetical protein [Pantoea rodasii]|uniref:hypothetical protein n=1 Tax=Pantoea rodasii TaxID=1076549 RepID=UPI0012FD5429|nr:hypothetical protein [Pantoea rodasii]